MVTAVENRLIVPGVVEESCHVLRVIIDVACWMGRVTEDAALHTAIEVRLLLARR